MTVAHYVVVRDNEFSGGGHFRFTLPENAALTGRSILTWHLLEIYGEGPIGYAVHVNSHQILTQLLEPRIWNATVTETFPASHLQRGNNTVAFSLTSGGNLRVSDVVLWFEASSF